MVAALILYAKTIGVALTFGEAYRTQYQQDEYVRISGSKVKRSQHQDRLAVDFNIFINGEWIREPDSQDVDPLVKSRLIKLGEYWESLDKKNRWGGRFGIDPLEYITRIGWDAGHFETRR